MQSKLIHAGLCMLMCCGGLGVTVQAENYVLPGVVVTASRIPIQLREAHADISVIDREQLDNHPVKNMESALRMIPGIQFLNYGGAGGLNANLNGIRINGSKNIVILVDGVRQTDFRGTESGYAAMEFINNTQRVERIEVLRGAAGVLYGSNAQGGVINIITRQGQEPLTSVDIARGGFGLAKNHLYSQGGTDALGYNAYYSKDKTGSITDGDGKRQEGNTDMESGGIKLRLRAANRHEISLSYEQIHADFSGRDDVYNNHYGGWHKENAWTAEHSLVMGEHWTHRLTYRRNETNDLYEQNYKKDKPNYAAANRYAYTFVSEQLTYSSEKHRLAFGYDYSQAISKKTLSKQDNGTTWKGYPNIHNHSFFAQDEWSPGNGWHFTLGVRHDRPGGGVGYGKVKGRTSRSYRVAKDFGSRWSVFAAQNDFVIIPTPNQLFSQEYGNPGIKPGYGKTRTIGFNLQPNNRNLISWNWYETKADVGIGWARIVEDETGTPVLDEQGRPKWRYQNTINDRARGWNLQWISRPSSRWNIQLGWAHLRQKASGDNFARGYQPKDLLTLAINYDRDKWSAGMDGFFFIRRKVYERALERLGYKGWPADKFPVLNFNLAYRPNPDWKLYLRVENFTNQLWAEHTDVIWSQKPGAWYSMPGRNFIFGAEYRF